MNNLDDLRRKKEELDAQLYRAEAEAVQNEVRQTRQDALFAVARLTKCLEELVAELDAMPRVQFLVIDWDKGNPEVDPEKIFFGLLPVRLTNKGRDFEHNEGKALKSSINGNSRGRIRNLEGHFQVCATQSEIDKIANCKGDPRLTSAQVNSKTWQIKRKSFDQCEKDQRHVNDPRFYIAPA